MPDTTRIMTNVAISIVPANEASCDDLKAILGTRGYAAKCQCQWFRTTPAEWPLIRADERAERLRAATCGPGPTSGPVGAGRSSSSGYAG